MRIYSTKPEYIIEDRGYTTPCHIWQRSTSKGGYGTLHRPGVAKYAHVAAWEELHGPVPNGMELDHLCRQPPCRNPDHLEPVTHTENVRRGTHTILTLEDVRLIRELRGRVAGVELALRFGVSKHCISKIHTNKIWVDPDYEVISATKDIYRLTPLTPDDIAEIRALRGIETGISLAKRFGVCPSTISAIQLGRRFK